MTGVLRRLARASAGELQFRGREKASIAAEALRVATGRARWRRRSLAPRLVAGSARLEQARTALGRSDWSPAALALRSHFMERAPRFVIDPARQADLAAAVRARFPGSVDNAVGRAGRVLDRRYDLLGYRGLSFDRGSDIDWHFDPVLRRRAPATFWTQVPYLDAGVGDHKVIWELNRHQHWLTLGRAGWLTGDARYAAAFAGELESWLRANPPLTGINWSSMLELAFRSISWVWAIHLFAPFDDVEPTWLLDLLVGLDEQLEHVSRHLSFYFSPNTHLLGEALALYVGGRVLPELAGAARWEEAGRDILIREARVQILADGAHAELSTHYHRYALDFYLLALAIARKTNDSAADDFADAAARLAGYCQSVADDGGRLPAIGDDDGGMLFPMCGRAPSDASDSLAVASALLGRPELRVGADPEEVLWLAGGRGIRPDLAATPAAPASRLFADSGYAVLRSSSGHAIVDGGRHGFLNGGHAHADALSLVLSVGGRPLLIDPGTATYTTDDNLRNRFRSTPMHNTVVVDGKSQSVPAGPFHWHARADARIDCWRSSPFLDYVDAHHGGYAPLVHRRAVLRLPDGAADLWLVADHILGAAGSGPHRLDAYWHVDPAWTVHGSGRDIRFAHRDGMHAAIASTAGERQDLFGEDDGLGWHAPVYGRIEPAPTVRCSDSARTPASMVTAIAGAAAPVRLTLDVLPIVAGQDGWHRAAVAVGHNDASVLAMFAAPLETTDGRKTDNPPARSMQRVALPDGEFTTDARLAVLRFSRSGEPASLSLIGGSAACWSGPQAFSLPSLPAADAPSAAPAPDGSEPGDLHLGAAALRRLAGRADARLVG